ncbi:MAG: hypothetical protein KAH07_02495 [Flavobacteriaceae bacterium]|nr:hypothetical protein [Flavobacteriaceae bacterium]
MNKFSWYTLEDIENVKNKLLKTNEKTISTTLEAIAAATHTLKNTPRVKSLHIQILSLFEKAKYDWLNTIDKQSIKLRDAERQITEDLVKIQIQIILAEGHFNERFKNIHDAVLEVLEDPSLEVDNLCLKEVSENKVH